ncbi:U-box domain-containing protein 34 isoform X2 [Cynara cardunculus var. scolymus]|uniref:U-box domain-containing protein 34 isoform X2 n=1 Tax=Cynara cardunculus var. scolymus TaxID=59895 RepID=UPI000D62A748|nr:U-box domain-containing protein 34 isoform X2 [Cynara cardunculus var. scolymus]
MNSTSTIDSDGSPSVVAVAVTGGNAGGIGGKGSRRAVCWAVENLFQKADRFVLIHVIPNITSIPNPSGKRIPIVDLDAHVVDMYVEDLKSHIEEVFLPFKRLCKGKKIETLVIEGDSPASGLVNFASGSGINSLVLGSCYSNWLMRKLYGAGVPSTVLKHAPTTCNIYVVSRRGLISDSESSSCGISKLWCGFCSSSRKSKIESTSASTQENASINSSTVKRSSSRRTLGDAISQTRVGNGTSMSSTCSNQSNLQAEVEKLRLELRNALNMYNQACDELVHTENKVQMLSHSVEDAKKISSAVEREEKFRKIAAEEKEKHLEAVKEVEIARNLLAKEANEREIAELKALKESSEKQEVVDALFTKDKRYRRYSIDEIEVATDSFSKTKVVGEGAYGKVYKCNLDHTPVAIKVLWSDTSEKRREFLREVEVLSQLSHPHMVQLLGACPERGCLIYEYMENGSLEDYIFQATTTSYLSWSTRFRIAFEVACALAFLHNSKPEPIVHRDLKPGNILLDRNFVSKIGDVGMAKLITDVVPDNVTEYKDSILAGTMYYIDPEYHRTGTVRPKSDLYAFGIIVLQLLTSLQPKGIIPMVESAISRGTLSDILDDSIADWPLAEAEELAELGLKCCSLRCRDRPDLDTEVLPVLKKLYEFGDTSRKVAKNSNDAPNHFYCPILQEVMDDPHIAADGFTYEHRAIQIWLERQNVSPMTKRKLQHKTLTPNHTLRSAIQDWRLRSTSSRSQV